jgi:hypothetical protein
MESQSLDQRNISMAVRQLADIIADDQEIGGCSLEQRRVGLNVVSNIISNVAQYVLNRPTSEPFDSTVRLSITPPFDMCNYSSITLLLFHSRLSMGQRR